ncbi:MAG: 3'-5' exonuclease [Verrucomicrobiota bacterium]
MKFVARPEQRERRFVRPSSQMACALAALLFFSQALAADVDTVLPVDRGSRRTPPSNTFVSNVTFVVFDTETTGFSPTTDRIVEVAAVRFRNGKVLDEKSWLINPQRGIPSWAYRVHGISEQMVKDQPTFRQFYPEFQKFIGDSVLIAHHAQFDIAFLSEEAKRAGYDLPGNRVIDSLGLFRRWFPGSRSYSLEVLVQYTRVDADSFHRALTDSMHVFRIFGKGLADREPGVKLGDLYTASGGPLRF